MKQTYFIHIYLDGKYELFDSLFCFPKDVKARTKAKLKAKKFADYTEVAADVWEMNEYDTGNGAKLFSGLAN